VIVLPGFLANREAYFNIINGFDDYMAIVLSPRGQGSEGELNVTKTADDTIFASKFLRKEYGVKKVGVIAHSYTSISSMIAAKESEEIDSLALLCAMTKFTEPRGPFVNTGFKLLLHSVGLAPWLWRRIANYLNRKISESSDFYNDLSYKIFCEQVNQKEDIFFNGLTIHNPNAFVRNCLESPSSLDFAPDISAPVLFLYGGNDLVLGVNKHHKIPEKYMALINSIGKNKENNQVYCVIISDADHCFNKKTIPDMPLNYSKEFHYMRRLIQILKLTIGGECSESLVFERHIMEDAWLWQNLWFRVLTKYPPSDKYRK